METSLRVLIVAGDSLARAGLGVVLADQPGLTVVGQVPNEAAGDDLVEVFRPDVILWDLGWDPAPALGLLSEVSPPVLALVPDAAAVDGAWAAGCRGILPRDADTVRLSAALRAVCQGLLVGQPEFSAFASRHRDQPPSPTADVLTAREHEVLALLAEGLPNKAIAARLEVSEHTVKFHVNAIMGKLGAQSRTEAVTKATRSGLILL